ncbi:MAG: DUF1499 domain-containing protein [Richelia sp. RM2_1_2]|nr:DUF1499 domain-containing protein [Richelia sp. SM1_7_0]NJN12073.1 DUF1499 domain-containing protein [Richelia sp. RM1_1_1]NJO30439.1 DUF1499 domain-containing protein [Richelia sp. SL_2_1]NJO62989.1 DUF1499 domain-containing protein [Richelia sp. RM2_1_2]
MIFSGTRPNNLGINNGKLAACPNSPNCVSSQSSTTDATHFIQPLNYTDTPEKALSDLKAVIESEPRTKIINESSDYLYAEFKSALMGYVDDVEFYVDSSSNTIHVRSASRLGQSDLGVNRKRVETIRTKFNQMQNSRLPS